MRDKYIKALKIDKEHTNKHWQLLMEKIETEKVSTEEIFDMMNRLLIIDRKIIKEGSYELLG